MTTEEKAKAYDKALEIAKKNYGTAQDLSNDSQIGVECFKNTLTNIFPELKESEDEKIRKELICFLETEIPQCNARDKYIAWLEKQKELTSDEEKQGKADVLWCINKARQQAKDENEMGTCWFAEKWLEKQGEYKETNNFDVLPGLYKCVHRMFDGTPDGKLLFEIGNVYKCLSKHDRAEFEVSYGHSVYLEDPVVYKHFIPYIEKQCEQNYKIIKGKNYFCVKTHNYAGVEWIKGTKYYASDNYTLVNQGCECYCPEYSKEDHNNLFEEVKYDGCVEKQNEPIDKVKPKFKVGDWVILTAGELSTTLQIINVDTNKKLYWFNDNSYLPIVDEEYLHYWTIKDAKEGDVLFQDLMSGITFIYNGINPEGYIEENKNIIHPATKEQRELLFKKMKEEGYEWDAEKKELKIIDWSKHIKYEPNSPSIIEEKLWTEEDESNLDLAIYHIRREPYRAKDVEPIVDWLRILKDRVQPKQEWSEEDEKIYQSIIDDTVQENQLDSKQIDWLKNRVKSLRPLRTDESIEKDEGCY